MRHLSDEEYVENIRKKVNTVNRLRWFWPVLFLCLFAGLIYFVELMPEIAPNPDKYTALGFSTGIIFGLFLLFTTAKAAECLRNWWEAYRGWKTERLLLKYYDELQANQRGHGTR